MKTKFKLTEQNYRYMFDNASDAMWVHDMEGKILAANKACEKLTGYTRRELIGMNVTRFLTPEFLNTATEVKRRLLEGEEFKQPYEQKLVRKDGRTRILETAISLVIADGDMAGIQVGKKPGSFIHAQWCKYVFLAIFIKRSVSDCLNQVTE